MSTKTVVVVLLLLAMAGGITVYVVYQRKEPAVHQQQAPHQKAPPDAADESRKALRKGAEMLVPDAGKDLSFSRQRSSTATPTASPTNAKTR